MKKFYRVNCGKYIVVVSIYVVSFRNLKYQMFSKKTLLLSIICSKCQNEDEELFKEEETIEVLTVLGLIENK